MIPLPRQFLKALFGTIARIGQHAFRFGAAVAFSRRCHRHQTTIAGRALLHLTGDGQPRLPLHSHLRVVALLKTIAGLHDPVFRIGEVVLLLVRRLAKRAPVLGPASLRARRGGIAVIVSSPARLPAGLLLPLLQPSLIRLDLCQALLAEPEFFRNLIPSPLCAIGFVLSRIGALGALTQCLDLLPQTCLFLLHPAITHRLVLLALARNFVPSSTSERRATLRPGRKRHTLYQTGQLTYQ